MSISLSRLRDTRIEEDSDNSTSYKYLLVRNVFGITFFFSNFFVLACTPITAHRAPCFLTTFENILRQAKRQSRNRTVLHVLSLTFENILRQAKRAELVTALRATCFLVINHSKTFRTRRSLEECKFFESLLSL